jgi:histone H3/H4
MDRDNVISIEAHKLADKIMAEWISAYSDNGAIWQTAYDELQAAKKRETEEIYNEAVEIAQRRWRVMHHLD